MAILVTLAMVAMVSTLLLNVVVRLPQRGDTTFVRDAPGNESDQKRGDSGDSQRSACGEREALQATVALLGQQESGKQVGGGRLWRLRHEPHGDGMVPCGLVLATLATVNERI